MTDATRPEASLEASYATRTLVRDALPVGRRMRTYRLRVRHPDGRVAETEVSAPTLRAGSRRGNDLVLDDPTVSRLHFEIVAGDDGYRLRDLGSTNGTTVDGYRTRDIHLRGGSVIRAGQVEITFEPTARETELPIFAGDVFGPLVGRSIAMRELFAVLARAAPSEATVLVEGETGTGKELFAQAIHGASRRQGGPFVVVDCAAIPATLFESLLFGHEKGAFTGATERRAGRLEEADGGTVFLDELGELPLDLQPKLLRALEAREVRRVGGTKNIPIDVRVIAATNRDLAEEVNRGAFREDLYYRVAVVRVQVPPLRGRREDIPLLVEHFVRRALRDDPARADQVLTSIREENWARLRTHSWPGNVRELRNVIERSLALGGDEPPVLDPEARESRPASGPLLDVDLDRPYVDLKRELLERFDDAYLSGQLDRHGGNISRAARAAGLERMHFKRLLKKHRD